MGIAYRRACSAREKIKRHHSKCLVIHYACQSLYDDREGLSPNIACIVVKDLDKEQTVSFAIHFTAEKHGIDKTAIKDNFERIEKLLLEEFYEFVRNKPGHIWLHWNMKNIHYGFETLAHRYNILTEKNAPNIDVDDRINIAGTLMGLYGDNYVSVPHIPKLMEINGGVRRDFVAGKDEVELFKNGDYARLHGSTLAKVNFFGDVVELMLDRKLKVEKPTIFVRIERATDHVGAKLIGLAASVYTVIDLFLRLRGSN
jgi:hypothetical protein